MDITFEELEKEISESEKDLLAFTQAYDVLMKRCIESRDLSPGRKLPVEDWAGTHAAMNSLDVFMNNIKRTLDELKDLRDNTPRPPPRLRIVRNDGG